MNPLNYASLSASKRLVEAGIVLETEEVWYQGENGTWYLSDVPLPTHSIPAPCMAEVWRELPEKLKIGRKQYSLHFEKWRGESYASYENRGLAKSTNPTDALIDLLIWVRQQGKED